MMRILRARSGFRTVIWWLQIGFWRHERKTADAGPGAGVPHRQGSELSLTILHRFLLLVTGDAGNPQQIIDLVRRKRADELLPHSAIPLSEVCHLLGYSGQSSFNRACRRWYGRTPLTARRRLR
jgi:hypothetical protein